ncbi:MAG: hypothetical protein DMF91_20005 [Acidobacteria bacterium]|nr:MAG: hypothetical protein DMF91_20005 [Acidobacteriota bacterium]
MDRAKLGLQTIDEICRGRKGGSLDEFCRHVENAYLALPAAAEGSQPMPQSCRVANETVI